MSAPDLSRLTQGELLRLVNGTDLGEVLTRSALRAHLDAGGAHFLDGRRIHFLRYTRWLATRIDRPAAPPIDYNEARRRQAERNRAATKAAQDIAPIPEVGDWPRRLACREDLRLFCETYFPVTFHYPWCPEHLAAIATLQRIILEGGLFAFAMPRGSGKTSLARAAAIWALLYNRVAYVCLIAATETLASEQLLEPIKLMLLENRPLASDFPEAVFALARLENSSKRQLQQHCANQLTHVRWEPRRIVFPWIGPESLPASIRQHLDPADSDEARAVAATHAPAAQGSAVSVASLDGAIRGLQHTRPDGAVIRPGLVLLDDPQTRESAASSSQSGNRWKTIHGDVLGLAGPDATMRAVALVTVIYDGDLSSRLLDPMVSPDWQSQRTKFFRQMPSDMSAWEQYRSVRHRSIQAGRQGREATAMYRRRHTAMDAGAEVYWQHAYDHVNEISAIQHGMNLYLRDAESFAAEYQNCPITAQLNDERLTVQQVMEKLSGRPRGQAPQAATHVTTFIDLGDKVLFWCACAWEPDFTGHVLDYGAYPEQRRAYWQAIAPPVPLTNLHPGGKAAAIQAGLEKLATDLLHRDWPRAGGGNLRAGKVLMDAGYKGELPAAVKFRLGGDTLMLSRGVGFTCTSKPLEEYHRKPGEQYGHHWYVPNVRGTRDFPHIRGDVNYWKTFVHAALAAPMGERGGLTLYGSSGRQAAGQRLHEMFAEHVANSEMWVDKTARGRTVREWSARPSKPDNHWFDCLVGCAVAASFLGIKIPNQDAVSGGMRQRKRYTQADLGGSGRR